MTRLARLRRPELCCVVLAAGGSSRLGVPKQLLRSRLQPLLLGACEAAEAVTPGRVRVVLGAEALRLRRLLREHAAPLETVVNAAWREGMGGSLQLGLTGLPPRCGAALIVLCDQAELGSAALERLIRAWRRRPNLPAAARYGGRVGAPAILPRGLWPRARALRGDAGARELLRAGTEITVVDIPEAALDIDTGADLERLGRTRRPLSPRRRRAPRPRAWRN